MFDSKVDLVVGFLDHTIRSFEDWRKLVIAWKVSWNAAFDMITDEYVYVWMPCIITLLVLGFETVASAFSKCSSFLQRNVIRKI